MADMPTYYTSAVTFFLFYGVQDISTLLWKTATSPYLPYTWHPDEMDS